MFDGYKHKVQRTADKCVLVVTNVGPDDCGEVECRAYNAAGIASNRAQLSLQGIVHPTEFHQKLLTIATDQLLYVESIQCIIQSKLTL